MPQDTARSSILDGIKLRARLLRAERNLKQHEALDRASIDAGYQNFRHAQNVAARTSATTRAPSQHRLFISAHWGDRTVQGREMVSLDLPARLEEFITASQLANKRSTRSFRLVAPDHLESRTRFRDQHQARYQVCHVARVVQFILATRLRPAKGWSRAFPGVPINNRLPGADHSSVWFDPITKRYVFVDEPYGNGSSWTKSGSREAWAEQNDFTIAEANWSMYHPIGMSRMFLVSHNAKGLPLQPVLAALAQSKPAIVEEPWRGASAEGFSPFVSPGAIERSREQMAKKANKKPRRPGPRATIGFVQTFVGPRRRPNTRMPIEAHEEVAKLLGIVMSASESRKGVSKRLDLVRSDLDEWVQREYTVAELPQKRFHEMYYGERPARLRSPRMMTPPEAIEHCGRLDRVREILSAHYPECEPLRALQRALDAAKKSLVQWSAKVSRT